MKQPRGKERTEWYIKKKVREILIQTKWDFWMPSAGIYGRSGVSDFLAVKAPQMFMVIETKYKDVPTAPQLAFLKMIDAAGHYAFLVDETNIERLRHVLTHQHERSNTELGNFEPLMKWGLTEHDHPPTNQKRSSEAARSITSALDLSQTEPLDRRGRG